MGNKLCCEETKTHSVLEIQTTKPPAKPAEQTHVPILTSDVYQRPAEQIHVPILTSDVYQRLKAKKFFQQELNNQTRAETRKYGTDVYEGTLDEKGQKPHGFGRMYKQDKSHYIGHFNHGKGEGKGVYIFPDGSYYYGQFHNNQAQSANGEFLSETIHYRGGFSNNAFEGQGIEQGRNHLYKGEFHNGARTKGLLKWESQNHSYTYEGEFNYYNQFHGKGVLRQAEGTYEGEFVNGQKHGYGVYKSLNGPKYEGTYVNGVREGRGTIYQKDGSVAYSGQIKNGLPHGKGKAPAADGRLIEAQWVNGIEKTLLTQ